MNWSSCILAGASSRLTRRCRRTDASVAALPRASAAERQVVSRTDGWCLRAPRPDDAFRPKTPSAGS